jgi:hypothetical protein
MMGVLQLCRKHMACASSIHHCKTRDMGGFQGTPSLRSISLKCSSRFPPGMYSFTTKKGSWETTAPRKRTRQGWRRCDRMVISLSRSLCAFSAGTESEPARGFGFVVLCFEPSFMCGWLSYMKSSADPLNIQRLKRH